MSAHAWWLRQQYGFGAARLLVHAPPLARCEPPARGAPVAPVAAFAGLVALALAVPWLAPRPQDALEIVMLEPPLPAPTPEPPPAPEIEAPPEPAIEEPAQVVAAIAPPVARSAPAIPQIARPVPPPAAPRVEAPRAPALPQAPEPLRAPELPRVPEPPRAPEPTRVVARPMPSVAAPRAAPEPVRVARLAPPAPAAAPLRAAARPEVVASVRAERPAAPRAASAARPQPAVSAPAAPAPAARKPSRGLPERPAAPAASASASSHAPEPLLAGVPLGSLASCVSDREEDRLKREVIALVSGRGECTSEAGRYRFLEARNLNAFLMSIERAPSRRAVDRCVELSLALDCLGAGGRVEARRG
jgi:hypothetical protein